MSDVVIVDKLTTIKRVDLWIKDGYPPNMDRSDTFVEIGIQIVEFFQRVTEMDLSDNRVFCWPGRESKDAKPRVITVDPKNQEQMKDLTKLAKEFSGLNPDEDDYKMQKLLTTFIAKNEEHYV